MYVLAGVYGLVFGLRGVVESFSLDPIPFYLLGRALTATMGTATVAVLYLIAAESYGASVGVLASAFLTVILLHVRDSHFITPDVPLTFLLTLAILFVFRYWRDGRARDAWWSGLFTGLAASMKYPGGLALLPFLLAHFLRPRPPGPVWRWVASPRVGVAGVAALLGFVAGTPYAVLTPLAFWRGVMSELRAVHSVQFGNEADLPGYLFHLTHSFPQGMGLPLFVLALGGLALALRTRTRRDLLLLAFPLPYFLVIGSWSSRFERYTLPLLPFMAVLAALCLVALVRQLRRASPALGRRSPAVALGVVACLLLAPEIGRLARFHVLLGRPDTRLLAKEWINREIPAGARLFVEAYSPTLQLAPGMIREQRERLGGGVTAEISRSRFERFLASPEARAGRGYWVYWFTRPEDYDVDRLLARKVEYVVLSGFVYQRHERACDRYAAICGFYRDLERRGTLLVTVDPSAGGAPLVVGDIYTPLTRLYQRSRPGPPIRIYRLPVL